MQATHTLDKWWKFFDYAVAKFHDGYIVNNRVVEMIVPDKIFYPRWWLESVGYWGRIGETSSERAAELKKIGEYNYEKEYIDDNGKVSYKTADVSGVTTTGDVPDVKPTMSIEGVGGSSSRSHFFTLVLGVLLGVGGLFLGQKYASRGRGAFVYERV